jgi:hypothetical protein
MANSTYAETCKMETFSIGLVLTGMEVLTVGIC